VSQQYLAIIDYLKNPPGREIMVNRSDMILQGENNMVIEWLRFKVPPEKWEAFIQRDEEVWRAGLKNFPGFLGK
jgi:hypothetical protein